MTAGNEYTEPSLETEMGVNRAMTIRRAIQALLAVTLLALAPGMAWAQRLPVNGATNVSTLPTLSWSSLGPQAPKDVWFSCGTNSMVLVASQIAADSWTPTAPVKANTTCYWRFDVHKNSEIETGVRWSFKTASAPTPLAITCPANISRDTVTVPISVTFPDGNTSGGVAPLTVTSSPTSGSQFGASPPATTVTQTVTDSVGSAPKSCTFTVTVNQYPALTWASVPPNQNLTSAVPMTVTYTAPVPAGGKAPISSVTCDHPSGSQFPLGLTTVNCDVHDSLSPAQQSIRATFTVTITAPAPAGSTPFGGTPATIPGQIEAERFDEGGEGVAYHDLDPANQGNQFRTTGVDIQTTSDTGGGFMIGWIQPGEWLAYTVNVATGSNLTLGLRVASMGQGGTFHLEIDGQPFGPSFTVPDTGGWDTWTTLQAPVSVTTGPHLLKVRFDTAGPTNYIGNLNWISIAPAGTPPPPGSVAVGWDPNPASDNVTNYQALYGTTSGQYTGAIDSGTATTVTIPGLVAGTTYFVVVRAFNGLWSLNSLEVSGVAH